MSTVVCLSKLQGEQVNYEFDFLSRLAVGESALTIAATVEVDSGVDPNPAAMLSGLPSLSGTLGRQRLIGGLPGVIYKLTMAVRTSNSQILLNQAKIAVLTSNVTPPP
jgi:hypothetical protein